MIQPTSGASPDVFTRTQNFDFTHSIANLKGVVLKNKVNNYFDLEGYCGQYTELKWYAGWFTTSSGLDYDIHASILTHWKLDENPINSTPTDVDFTVANNNVDNTRDLGQMGSSTVVPPSDSSTGIKYKKNERITFNGVKSLFGDDFMITFWVNTQNRVAATSPNIGIFKRVSSTGSKRLEIQLPYNANKNQLKVSILGTNADPHGAINFDNSVWTRILIVFFKNRKYGTTFFHIISPNSFEQRNIPGNNVYQEDYNDVYYIGDHNNFGAWASDALVRLRDFKVYQGAHYVYDTTESCTLYVSEIFPSCINCLNLNNDPHDYCSEAARVSASSRLDCPGRMYDTGEPVDPCQPINLPACLRGTDSGCDICEPPDTGSTCTETAFSLCTTGMIQCIRDQINNDTGLIDNLSSLSCEDKYYRQQSGSIFECLDCDPSCATCSADASCDTCPDGEFVQLDLLCAVGCGTDFEDHVNMRCVVECDPNYNVLDDDPLKQCVLVCPSPYVLQGSVCQAECDAEHYLENNICYPCAAQCTECEGPFNIQCQACSEGNYLEVNKCETFCADSSMLLDQTEWKCVAECPVGSQQLGYYCIKTCPTVPILLVEHFGDCIEKCPDGYIAKLLPNDEGIERLLCVPCYENCAKCYDEMTTDANGKAQHNCYVCKNSTYNYFGNCEYVVSHIIFNIVQSAKTSFRSRTTSQWNVSLHVRNRQAWPLLKDALRQVVTTALSHAPLAFTKMMENASRNVLATNSQLQVLQSMTQFIAGYCVSCSEECLICHGPVATMCDECRESFFLVGTTCTNNCPEDLPFKDIAAKTCIADCLENQYKVEDGLIRECLSACPNGYTENDLGGNFYECISGCPLGKYELNGICEDCAPECLKCENNTNRNCSRCADGFLLDGKSCGSTCLENPQFYKQDYYFTCVEKCDPTLYTVEDLLRCMSSCPNPTHFRFESECLTQCPDLYYADLGMRKCEKCAGECTECYGATRDECYACVENYYMQDTTCTLYCAPDRFQYREQMLCVSTCPDNYYSDDDGAGNKNCLTQCHSYKFALDFKCYFTCPDGYYNNSSTGECTLCTIECLTCVGPTNYDCVKCQVDFYFNGLQACIGECPSSTFYNGESCQLCSFRCLECEFNKFNCKQCRGNRLLPLCLCEDGYFDDGIHNECQKCIPPCVTCQSLQICDSCPYNTSPPTCTCKRAAPIETEWCISCTVGFPNIKFSEDLIKLEIQFTYEIQINSDDSFFNSFSNCEKIFSYQTLNRLGQEPTCAVDVNNRSRILVSLGDNAKVVPGESVHFTTDGIEDVSTTQCKDQFIEDFRTNNINPPSTLVKSDIILYYPDTKWNVCLPFDVVVIKEIDSGLRSLMYDSWKLISGAEGTHLDNINSILAGASKKVSFKSQQLQQFTNYVFEITFTNFLLETNTKQFTIETIDNKSPIIDIEIDYTHSIHANVETVIPFQIKAFDCTTGSIIESDDVFQTQVTVTDMITGSPLISEPRIIEKKDRLSQVIKIEAFKLQPEHEYEIKVSIKSDSKSSQNSKLIFVDKTPLQVVPITPHRIVSNKVQEIEIQMDAYDPDVFEEQYKRVGLTFKWGCKNMGENKACSYTDKRPIKMSTNSSLIIENHKMELNYVFLFYCTVTKDTRTQIGNQYIIVTNETNLEVEPFEYNNRDDLVSIHPANKLLIQAQELISLDSAPWIFLLYENILRGLLQMSSYTTEIFIYNYQKTYPGSKVVTVSLTQVGESQKFEMNAELQHVGIEITPRFGESLKDTFTISVTPAGFLYSYYVYFYEDELLKDKEEFTDEHGYLLSVPVNSNRLESYLPAAIYNQDIHILVKIENVNTGNIAYVRDTVNVFAPEVTNVRRNILRTKEQLDFITFNKEDKLIESYMCLLELYIQESKSCFQECSGRGDCQEDYSCLCDSEWYLSDCSGGFVDSEINQELLEQILDNLLYYSNNINQILLKSFQLFLNLHNSYSFQNQLIEKTDTMFEIVKTIFVEEENQIAQSHDDIVIQQIEGNLVNMIVKNQMTVRQSNVQIATTFINSLIKVNVNYYKDNKTNSSIAKINKNAKKMIDQLIDLYFSGLQIGEIKQLHFNNIYVQLGKVYGQQLNKLHSLKIDTEELLDQYITEPKTFVYITDTTLTLDQLLLEQQMENEKADLQNEEESQAELQEESEISGRFLQSEESEEEEQQSLNLFLDEQIYDFVLEVWAFNVFKFENDFPYPETSFPIMKYSIRKNDELLDNQELNLQFAFNYVNQTKAVELDSRLEEERQNIICIQLEGKEWVDEPCNIEMSQMNKTGMIYCTCKNSSYVSVVNDYKYIIKPFYTFSNVTLDRKMIPIILGSLTLFMLVMIFIGRLRDNADWDKIRPNEQGFGARRRQQVDDNIHEDAKKKSVLISNLNTNVKRVNFGFENKLQQQQQQANEEEESNDLIAQMIKQQGVNKEKEKNRLKQQAMMDVWGSNNESKQNVGQQWGGSIKFRKQKQQEDSPLGKPSMQLEQDDSPQNVEKTPEITPMETPSNLNSTSNKVIDSKKLEFNSNHHLKYFHKTHTLLAIVFRFRRFLSRPQRGFNVLGRYLLLFGLSGAIIERQTLPFYQVVLIVVAVGFVHRVVNGAQQSLNMVTDRPKGECQYKCFSFFLSFAVVVAGYLLVAYYYFFSNDDLLVYWVLCFLYSGAAEVLLVDLVLQMCLFTKDYCAHSKQEAYRKALEEQELENQRRKLYGAQRQDSNEEINL